MRQQKFRGLSGLFGILWGSSDVDDNDNGDDGQGGFPYEALNEGLIGHILPFCWEKSVFDRRSQIGNITQVRKAISKLVVR